MPGSRLALACALAAGLIAAIGVPYHHVGLGLALALALVVATAAAAAPRRSPVAVALLLMLAAQPAVRDAAWVVALSAAATLAGAALVAAGPLPWAALGWRLAAPWRWLAGCVWTARALVPVVPRVALGEAAPVLRGTALAAGLAAVFGTLFATADDAFAQVAGRIVDVHLDAASLTVRLVAGLAFVVVAGALAREARVDRSGAALVPGRALPALELRIALGVLVALFLAFVVVQLNVLFGGADYVRQTTGLGFGDYARQGFVALLVVAGLTLAVIAAAGRTRDELVRHELGALCLLTLVVLVSAYHRLVLVQDAYGLTRVRYGGYAVVLWFAVVFALVAAAGVWRPLAPALPRVVAVVSLGGVLAFSLSNPDGRVAASAVARGTPDVAYLQALSADALPALERLPEPLRDRVVDRVRARISRRDGLWGANLSRVQAR